MRVEGLGLRVHRDQGVVGPRVEVVIGRAIDQRGELPRPDPELVADLIPANVLIKFLRGTKI